MSYMNLEKELTSIWKYSHQIDCHDLDEDQIVKSWKRIQNTLVNSIYKKNLPGIANSSEAQDAVMDFLADLFQKELPGKITTFGLLENMLIRYLVKKRNPVQYELDCILRDALRFLEKNKKIKRDSSSINSNISSNTRFTLIDSDIPECWSADFDSYEANCSSVPSYTCKIRNNDPVATKMISPTDARDLVLHLLRAFNGWTKKSDILKAMMRHIPEQLIFVAAMNAQNNEEMAFENIVADNYADSSIFDYDADLVLSVSGEIADAIWNDVCQVSTDSFCLYFLPAKIFKKKVVMQEIGSPSTVSDHIKRLEVTFRKHCSNFEHYTIESPRGMQLVKWACQKILRNLSGRCTEKGHSPHLYESKEEF